MLNILYERQIFDLFVYLRLQRALRSLVKLSFQETEYYIVSLVKLDMYEIIRLSQLHTHAYRFLGINMCGLIVQFNLKSSTMILKFQT